MGLESKSAEELKALLDSLTPSLKKIPKIIASGFRSPEKALRKKYLMRLGFIVITPYGAWRQGGVADVKEGEKEDARRVSLMNFVPYPILTPDGTKRVIVPIINGSTIHGALKNMVSKWMYDYYMENKRSVLENIFKDPDYGALAATLFRMKPPFLSSSPPAQEVIDAVWSNFIWTMWGIGVDSWTPYRKFTMSTAMPVYIELYTYYNYYEKIARKIFPDLPAPISLEAVIDESSEVSPSTLAGVYEGMPDKFKGAGDYVYLNKLRQPLRQEFARLGVEEPPKIYVGKRGNEYEDITKPMPVFYQASTAPVLLSVAEPAVRRALFSEAEIATLALALRETVRFGPLDNVMDIYFYFKFTPLDGGEAIELKGVTGPAGAESNKTVDTLAGLFEDWTGRVDYSEVVVPIAKWLYLRHLLNKKRS